MVLAYTPSALHWPSSPPRAAACFEACGLVGAWVRIECVTVGGGFYDGADDGRLTGSPEKKSNNRLGNEV